MMAWIATCLVMFVTPAVVFFATYEVVAICIGPNVLSLFASALVAYLSFHTGVRRLDKFQRTRFDSLLGVDLDVLGEFKGYLTFCAIQFAVFLLVPIAVLAGNYFSLRAGIFPPFLVALVAGVGGYCTIKSVLKTSSQKVIQGDALVSNEELTRSKRRRENFEVRWGNVNVPLATGTYSHFAVLGTTGSGKSTVIGLLLKSVLQSIDSQPEGRAVIFDAKRELVSPLHGLNLQTPICVLDPFDDRSFAWDISRDISAIPDAETAAETLFPKKVRDEHHFDQSARQVFATLIKAFIAKEKPWTLMDVIHHASRKERILSLVSDLPFLREQLTTLFGRDQVSADLMTTVASRILDYDSIARAWEKAPEKLSITEWAKGKGVLVLGNDPTAQSTLTSVNQLLLQVIRQKLTSGAPRSAQSTWMFLDELPEAGRIPKLANFMRLGRGYGIRFVLGFQTLEGIESDEAYGEKIAKDILGECSNLAILKLDSPYTAEWASKKFGEYLRWEETYQANRQSNSINYNIAQRSNVLPSQFLDIELPQHSGACRGYFITPGIGKYEEVISKTVLPELPKPVENIPNFVPREMTADDYLRVHELKARPEPRTRTDVDREKKRPSLFDVKRVTRFTDDTGSNEHFTPFD